MAFVGMSAAQSGPLGIIPVPSDTTGLLSDTTGIAIDTSGISADTLHISSDTIHVSLKEALDMALSRSLEMRESQLARDRALADQYEADMARWVPIFEIDGYTSILKDARGTEDQTIETSWRHIGPFLQLKGQIGQPITTFGRITSLRQAARYGVRAQEASIDVRRAEVAMNVYRYYYGILVARELLAILRDGSDKINTARARAREMLEEGSEKVTTTDLAKIDVYSFELERKRIEAEKTIRLAIGALRRELGVPYDTPMDVESAHLEPLREQLGPLDSLRQLAFAQRPEIRQVNAGVEARRLQLEAARAERWPTLFLGADFNFRYAPGRHFGKENPFISDAYNGRSVRAALGMKYQLGLSDREARIRRTRVDYLDMLRQQEWARASIALEVQKAYEEAVEAQENAALGRRSLRAGSAWLVQTVEQYDLGVASVRDLLEAYAAYGKSQSDYYQTLYDQYLAVAELWRTVGRPIWQIEELAKPPRE